MKKALGSFGILMCSAALAIMPAAAQDRGSYGNRNNSQNYQRGTTQQAPQAAPQGTWGNAQPSAPAYNGNSQQYRQQNNGNTQSYGQEYRGNTQSYGQGYAQNRQSYGGYSNGFERGRQAYGYDRGRESYGYDRDHYRRRFWRHNRWEWDWR
jgi:hypothetical protein